MVFSPVLTFSSSTCTPSAFFSARFAFIWVTISMPCLLMTLLNSLTASASAPGITVGRNSMILTLEPRLLYTCANSKPMTPPPTHSIRAGTGSGITRAPVLSTMLS